MKKKSCYSVIKSRRSTEKSRMLENLQHANSNPSLSKCNTPKLVFDVDPRANKQQIAEAIEEIYRKENVKVVSVNTISIKPKQRRVRGRLGMTAGGKKAVVTLQPGNRIDEHA